MWGIFMCKKIKVFVISTVLFCTSLFASDFDWSQCWCNYGAGIKKGDKILTVDAGVPWTYFDSFNSGGWAIPEITVDFQVACPIWKLPFTFGGYGSIGYEKYCYDYGDFSHFLTSFGGSATYHVRMPPKNLDLYSGLKIGILMDFSDYYRSGHNFSFDWGYNIGASWYFSDEFGVNLELGYPLNRFGMVFKF